MTRRPLGIGERLPDLAHQHPQAVLEPERRIGGDEVGSAVLDDGHEHVVARLPMAVDRRLGDTGAGDDGIDRDRRGTAFHQQVGRRPQHGGTGARDPGVHLACRR